ncbi:hypothetical protein ABVT39_005400 [Epinephelus coioides]
MTVSYRHPTIIHQAQRHTRSLTEQHQEAPSPTLLGPQEVMVPKVLQGFWLPPKNTSLNMPSQQLSKMVVEAAKAIEDHVSTAVSTLLIQVTFSRCFRDDFQECLSRKRLDRVTLLVKKLNCFATEVLNPITDIAVGEICALFQPQVHTEVDCIQPAVVVDGAEAETFSAEDVNEEPALEEDTEPLREQDSAVITPPPAPLTISAEPLRSQDELTPSAERPAKIGFNNIEEQPVAGPDPTLVSAPPPPVIPADEPPVTEQQHTITEVIKVERIQLLLQLAAKKHLLLIPA